MNIDNGGNEMPVDMDAITKSVNLFAIIVVVVTALLALLASFLERTFFTNIVHVVELIQALLVCSTALMGLSGLMVVEIKKVNITGLSSHDMLKKIKAINTIASLQKALVCLRWTMLLSIFSIVFSSLRLMFDNPVFVIGSLAAFIDQMYLFIFGLIFSDFLPS
jgi:hypothetical protein